MELCQKRGRWGIGTGSAPEGGGHGPSARAPEVFGHCFETQSLVWVELRVGLVRLVILVSFFQLRIFYENILLHLPVLYSAPQGTATHLQKESEGAQLR